ncbi:single-stranded DNA-binding protein [Bifidobacterium miconisargentati]|uniref:single-stranded DNA-binding protein n=1 Tax=Bifidobacterium miconisargentati TaxID=2834437 RepID=UPI001BDCB729|nr:single-stranded DNA-binding protein [Bifidobacterium miconisargentati]MBW3089410.1 single-stranded DNA-binding protein [Bifidobacterium miconisargentati]
MANQQAAVTITGFVAGDPMMGGTDSFPVLNFRMGSTRSRFNQNTRQWEEYGTAWIAVKAFRVLAQNTQRSVRRGDRVIVVGVLNTEQWSTPTGELRSRTVIEATNIGHDLTFGTTALTKVPRNGGSNAANGNGANGANGTAGAGNGAEAGTQPAQGDQAQFQRTGTQQYDSTYGPGVDPYQAAGGATTPQSARPVDLGITDQVAEGQASGQSAQQTGQQAPQTDSPAEGQAYAGEFDEEVEDDVPF